MKNFVKQIIHALGTQIIKIANVLKIRPKKYVPYKAEVNALLISYAFIKKILVN